MSAAVVFLVFTADWCEPCKQLVADFGAEPGLHFIESESNPDAVQDYRVTAYPTVVAIFDGGEIGRKTGYKGRRNFSAWMERMREDASEIEVESTSDEQKSLAVKKLFSIRDMLSSLSGAFDEIVAAARDEQASGLVFSALMLQESIVDFQTQLSSFVLEKLASK